VGLLVDMAGHGGHRGGAPRRLWFIGGKERRGVAPRSSIDHPTVTIRSLVGFGWIRSEPWIFDTSARIRSVIH
jgi:hypothetical protein